MARKALKNKAALAPKFSTRGYNRCPLCGRIHGYMRVFNMCRLCFRKLAREGKIPGVVKSSW
ncbi:MULTISPECIES: type Z 30S ribosomal protein S14 [Jonquetella]|uniref:Small ribosomal subunit protein uS14 n=1 Tax=Jonquetella anthropi DSM 22815 TaxID=885272 RepID=H0UL91_9BACT|nr:MULTISPECIES: type Z 30S ribosomal protein S14 [Jonquetella]EEX48012.1 ribosomal protein S14p/S29e [Jonquetella anthropi E3_33 E1]EHM13450.1 ribosomal protein S14 [Jonquetella anthropi DSM 22815]ERL24331.1 ribosomal protein S14p/S29e [Jonquetella sp. BV3C21]